MLGRHLRRYPDLEKQCIQARVDLAAKPTWIGRGYEAVEMLLGGRV